MPDYTGLIAAAYTPQQAQASTATAKGYDPTLLNVDREHTVAGQLEGIVAKNSPLMQQAERRAMERMNERGLINSSMAIGAGHEAVISQALPIAQQDASTHFTAAGKNADAKNAASAFKAGAENQASLVNAQLGTDIAKANAGFVNESRAKHADATNNLNLAKLDSQTRMELGQLDAKTRMDLGHLDANTRRDIASLDNKTRMDLGILDSKTRMDLGHLDATTRRDVASMETASREKISASENANRVQVANIDAQTRQQLGALDSQTRIKVAQLDAASRAHLTEIENRNRELLQANQNAANMYNSATNAINSIAIQPNLSPEAKQSAIQTQLNMLNEGLRTTGDISKMDLGKYFQNVRSDTNASGAVTEANMDRDRYLADNPGVVHAWQHYNTIGRFEGRQAFALPTRATTGVDTNANGRVTIDNMDRERYLRENPGVVHAWQHYNTKGRFEGRMAYPL